MNKDKIYELIKNKNIWYEITEHQAVFNMQKLAQIKVPYPERDAKNLFIRDDKKRDYYLITVKGDKKVDLKEFRRNNNTRPLTFASSEDLMEILNLIPGAVTPLGILNDEERKVTVFIDEFFKEEPSIIGIHPNDNTTTIWLYTKDLIDIIKEHGNAVEIINI